MSPILWFSAESLEANNAKKTFAFRQVTAKFSVIVNKQKELKLKQMEALLYDTGFPTADHFQFFGSHFPDLNYYNSR